MSHTIEMTQSQNCAKPILSSYEKDFELTFTHNSTAIEGNTLTLMETKILAQYWKMQRFSCMKMDVYFIVRDKNLVLYRHRPALRLTAVFFQ